ncbi:MAG: NACHT domain-containing protein, partial [Methylococcaceae bacterium]|nr:NACHT domain-containing protein [Methylococcaceae bacterium]
MDPQHQPKPSTEQIDQLLAFVSAHKEQVNDILNNAAGGIITVVVISVIVFLARQFHSQFQQFIGYLGSFRGLSKLAWWAYRRNVIDQYGKLINIYLGITEFLSLNQVFVPLTLRATRRTATPNPTQPPSTQAILTDPEQKRLLLLGAPGSGKSTLLRALAVGISRHEWPQFNGLIPVLVSLRDYAQKEPAQPLFTWLTEHELPRFGIAKPHSLLAAMLAKGRVLLLLDGLDEVAGERFDSINRAIAQFLTDYDPKAQCRVLLTCREQNYDALPDDQHYPRLGFKPYRVAELRDAEIRAIVHRRQTSFTDKQKSLPNYLAQVFRDSSILQLHRNPLLLTLSMGVFLHKPGEEIPHNLGQFYEQALDNLLRRHDFREAHSGQPANRYKAECKFKVLRYFAHQNLMAASIANRDFETFNFQDIKAAAQALAEQGRVDYKPDAAHEVVKEIQMQAGLLNALQDGNCYLYAHRSLNEYCAAAYLNRLNAAGFDLLSEHLTDTAWRQVIIFYAAIDDDNDNAVHLVTQLQTLAHSEHNPQLLALAGHCAAVLVQPRPELRLSLLADLATALQAETAITMRETLLKSLLALGNSRDTALRQRLDVLMRQLLEAGHIDELIDEISRLETAVALQFLSYLASSPEPSRKITALRGLSQFDSLDTIPLLWQLLGDFRAVGEAASASATLSRLLVLLAEDGAVERLNECAVPLLDVATRQQVHEVYPFLPVAQPATAFAVLLLWAKQAGVAGAATDTAWQDFLGLVLGDKTAAELKAWLKLPRDKDKWTGRVRLLTVGRVLFGVPV